MSTYPVDDAWIEWLDDFIDDGRMVSDLHQDDLEDAFKSGWKAATEQEPA